MFSHQSNTLANLIEKAAEHNTEDVGEGLSPLFFIFSFSSWMPRMVPLVLQILILCANRVR